MNYEVGLIIKMAWIEGLQESIGIELDLIVTTPEYNQRTEQEFYDYHNWIWRKARRLKPMRFRFNSPPIFPNKSKTGAIIIPDISEPNAIHSLWGTLIGINYHDGGTFDHPNANEKGMGGYRLIPKDISILEPSGIIRVNGDLVVNPEDSRQVNAYTTVEITRASNLYYVLGNLDKFFKQG